MTSQSKLHCSWFGFIRECFRMWIPRLYPLISQGFVQITRCCGGRWQISFPSSPSLFHSLWAPAWRKPVRTLCFFLEGTITCRWTRMEGTWARGHQHNNMCPRHSAGSEALWSKPQQPRNYCCLSFSIRKSLNTSRKEKDGTLPSTAPIRRKLFAF